MNADETVRGLRYPQKKYENKVILTGETDVSAMCRDSADLIESLQAQLAASQREKRAAVEDLRASGACLCCKNNGKTKLCQDCGIFANNFEWRGPQEAGKGEAK